VSTNVADALITEALETPWAITQAGLSTILAVLTRTNVPPEALERDRGTPLSNERNSEVTVRDGVAIVQVAGPMVRRGDFFSRVSGVTSYDRIARDLALALDTPGVRSILLSVDSPGGAVTGVSDLAAMIRTGSEKKPIVVHTDGELASAAYWLGSAATEIVASPTALVGSIGVRMAMRKEKATANDRMVTFEFVSSQSPKKAVDPETDAGRAQIMSTIDAMAQVFIETVAMYRGRDIDAVLAHFGQGDVLVGQHALDAGMIDRLGTFEDTLARLASRPSASTRVGVPRAVALPPSLLNTSGETMSMKKDTQNGAADTDEPTVTEAELTTRVTAARTEAGTAAIARVTALLALSSAAIEPALLTAISDGTSPEAFAYKQALAAKAAKSAEGDAEAKGKQAYIDAQVKTEKTLAAAGVQVPTAKTVEDAPDAKAEKKSRLLAAAKRTGLAKATTGGAD
jgi:capsid assembly protease